MGVTDSRLPLPLLLLPLVWQTSAFFLSLFQATRPVCPKSVERASERAKAKAKQPTLFSATFFLSGLQKSIQWCQLVYLYTRFEKSGIFENCLAYFFSNQYTKPNLVYFGIFSKFFPDFCAFCIKFVKILHENANFSACGQPIFLKNYII